MSSLALELIAARLIPQVPEYSTLARVSKSFKTASCTLCEQMSSLHLPASSPPVPTTPDDGATKYTVDEFLVILRTMLVAAEPSTTTATTGSSLPMLSQSIRKPKTTTSPTTPISTSRAGLSTTLTTIRSVGKQSSRRGSLTQLMLADDVDTIISKRAKTAAAADPPGNDPSLPLNSVVPEARIEEGSASSALSLSEVKMENLGSVTFWLRYMGYLPYSSRPHFLNRAIPYLHIFGVTFGWVMRGFAIAVDYRLKDGSFSNNMYLNAATTALFGSCILMLSWARSRRHTSFGSSVEAIATSKMKEDSGGGEDGEELLQSKKGSKPITGTQHSNLLLSFAAERVGAEYLHRKLTDSMKGYMLSFALLHAFYAVGQIIGIVQIINGSRPVYERFGSPNVDLCLQVAVKIISVLQAMPIAFLSPLYIYIYTQVFNELLDELVFFVATKRFAHRIDDGLVDDLELNNRDVLLLIIAEHKLIDSLLRVTCKRVERFVAFALATLAVILLLVVFKVVVAGGDVSQSVRSGEERKTNTVLASRSLSRR